jgi:hypothetical protein
LQTELIRYLSELQIEFDVSLTGFDAPEIDLLIDGIEAGSTSDDADVMHEVDPERRGSLAVVISAVGNASAALC